MFEHVTVYVMLISDPDYGVLRPVQAERFGENRFKVPGSAIEDEVRQFMPGTVVNCRTEEQQELGQPRRAFLLATQHSSPG